MINNRKMF